MILRRPSQTDKEAILEMMAEFEREQSAHDGGFWNPDNFVYEEWLEAVSYTHLTLPTKRIV